MKTIRPVRKLDLELRKQAAAGDIAAAIELGRRYLVGTRGMAANPKLALSYLAPHLDTDVQLRDEVVRRVPLEVLVSQSQKHRVAASAQAGDRIALRKIALWCALLGEAAGWDWLDRIDGAAGGERQAQLDALMEDATLGDALPVAEALLPHSSNTDLLRLALGACIRVIPESEAVRRTLLSAIRDAEAGHQPLDPLDRERLAEWLSVASRGSGYANFVSGCALLGISCGELEPDHLVPKRNFRLGYARLLRAAHGGHGHAWWALYQACSDYRSVVANREAARFFLECAAASGVTQAQQVMSVWSAPSSGARPARARHVRHASAR